MRASIVLAVLTTSTFLAACSGGGGTSSPVLPGSGSGSGGSGGGSSAYSPSITEASLSDANAVGTPVNDFATYDAAIAPTASAMIASSLTRATAAGGTGVCNNGIEFYAPDRAGNANSTETLDFYDTACTVLARDSVRIYSPTSSSSETVNVNASLYSPGSSTPIATRTATRTISSASFGANGFPVAADGFNAFDNNTLNLAGSRTIISGDEMVLQAASGNTTQNFCSDSSGYNATGFAKLNETFGWQGGVLSGGTRTANSDGSTTWTATHAGTSYKGPIGGLQIVAGTENTACPISTPMFTLSGGTSIGTYSIPVTVTYAHGMVENLTVTNATLANGTTINVQTNSTAASTSAAFITGTVSKSGSQIATFGVNAFGDGTVTVSSTGVQYVIVDWHVVH